MNREIIHISTVIGIAGVVCCLSAYGCTSLYTIVADRVTRRVRQLAFTNVLRQHVGYFDLHLAGELNTRLTQYVLIESRFVQQRSSRVFAINGVKFAKTQPDRRPTAFVLIHCQQSAAAATFVVLQHFGADAFLQSGRTLLQTAKDDVRTCVGVLNSDECHIATPLLSLQFMKL
jgi:ABC-type multidrug transport system fused ATPase/permease subunit